MRALDIIISALALILSAPVLAVIALLIKLESPGPAIFCQWRLGQHCRPFRFYKFRTMYADWPQRFPHLAHLATFQFDRQSLDRVFLQQADDPRVTPLGRFLRRTSLDELPNFWNVLRGEMSLVGPRPEVPEMLPYYESMDKFSVKPGLTCWAQIEGRGELSFLDTLRLDERYVRQRSAMIDLKILAGTLWAVFGGRGAY
ncbi:MAG TPA: sugar transferase [Chloroflexota bacterium]|jgi:lipopolysaccharide/colanic/teichoic acid biosynthesis glycosyltransferase|nr:sugar transferase [Chloroflexota bacterium]